MSPNSNLCNSMAPCCRLTRARACDSIQRPRISTFTTKSPSLFSLSSPTTTTTTTKACIYTLIWIFCVYIQITCVAADATHSSDFAAVESVYVNSTGAPIAGFFDPLERRVLFVTDSAAADSRIYTLSPSSLASSIRTHPINLSLPITAAVLQPMDTVANNVTVAKRGLYLAVLLQSAEISGRPSASRASSRVTRRDQSPRIYRLNPSSFEVEATIVDTFPEGRLIMVLDEGKKLYVASQSRGNVFYEIDISDDFRIIRSLSTLLNFNPSCGFVDVSSNYLYLTSYSALDPRFVRVNLTSFEINGAIQLPKTQGRISTIMYDIIHNKAYLPLDTRLGGLLSINLGNLTRGNDLKFNDGEQSLTTSYFDRKSSYGFVGSRSAPAYIYWVDFQNSSPSYLGKIALKVPEDFLYSVAYDPIENLSVWGGQGYFESPSVALFPFFVSIKLPIEKAPTNTPEPTQTSEGGKDSDSELSIPLPIFLAAIFVSIGAIALLGVIYYKKKAPVPLSSYHNINPTSENALPVDSQIKIIDYDEIEMKECIGMGGMGEVHRAIWNGTEIAVKRLHMTYQNLTSPACKDIAEEMLLHSSLRHPNIINFLGACIYVPNICICLEYMPRHSLYDVLHNQTSSSLEWQLMLRMALDAARGMNFLHCSKPPIIHRDLKSHNLLVDSNFGVKVTDFGSARMKQNFAYTMTCIGTPQWMAPEVIRGEKYTEKCDVFSFGVVLWELFTREDPHKGMNPIQVATAVAFRDLRPSVPTNCPPSYASLFTECWDASPKQRPHFRDILSRLQKMVSKPIN